MTFQSIRELEQDRTKIARTFVCRKVLKSEVLEVIEENWSVFNQSEVIYVHSVNSNVKAMPPGGGNPVYKGRGYSSGNFK